MKKHTQEDNEQGDPYLRFARVMILDTLRLSCSKKEKEVDEAWDFLDTEFADLCCRAIGVHVDHVADMMGQKEIIKAFKECK